MMFIIKRVDNFKISLKIEDDRKQLPFKHRFWFGEIMIKRYVFKTTNECYSQFHYLRRKLFFKYFDFRDECFFNTPLITMAWVLFSNIFHLI